SAVGRGRMDVEDADGVVGRPTDGKRLTATDLPSAVPDRPKPMTPHAVSPLRRACARYPDDAALAGLVADLRAGSAEFAARWDAREVREDSTARKTLRHGAVGEMTVNCDGLDVPDTDQRVVLST